MSDLLFNNSRPYSGLNELREAANLASTDYETQESYADALKEYGNKEDALEQFEKVSRDFPDKYVCREQAAEMCETAGKNESARVMARGD